MRLQFLSSLPVHGALSEHCGESEQKLHGTPQRRSTRPVFSQGNILLAFRKMLSGISGGKYEHVYMLWGLHFATLKRPEKKSDQKAFNALVDSFLETFTPKHMKLLASEAKSKIAADRNEEPEEDSIDRGVIDF